MATTIKDVAALAGVSPSTVSRVCNDHPSISRETRERVRAAMAELGYEPNTPAPQAKEHTRMIGVILPPSPRETYENSFHLEVIRGISQVCNQRQVACTIVTGQDDAEVLQAVQSLARSGQTDGFILLYSKKDDIVLDYLCEQGLLYVLIGKAEALTGQTVCIDNDNLLAGREATEYLYQLGHRRIAYLGSESTFVFSAERKSGYQLALLQHGLPVRPDDCIEMEGMSFDGADHLVSLLMRPDRPTALVVSDDLLAVGLERTCTAIGLRIPQDVSIISFNNSIMARLSHPQLTSVDVNSFQLGFEAASQILNHADNPNLMAAKMIVPHRIVERASCARIDA
ncbi:MAG: LacI family DNA-binding transcriptional regulator [Clostridia bacterium]|nr:LacI family DNA-binding transcriptional regulator [Clostridia bacterium]